MNEQLKDVVNELKKKIVGYTSEVEPESEPSTSFGLNILEIKARLDSVSNSFDIRQSSMDVLLKIKPPFPNEFIQERNSNEYYVKVQGIDVPFSWYKVNLLSGYLTTCWGGIYDQVLEVIKLIYLYKDNEDTKIKKNIKHLNSLFNVLQYGRKRSVTRVRDLYSNYGYFVSLYYQIRNMFVHGQFELVVQEDPDKKGSSFLLFDGLGFNVNPNLKSELHRRCEQRHLMSRNEIDSKSMVWSGSGQCLVEIIKNLENRSDKCAAELLVFAFKNLD